MNRKTIPLRAPLIERAFRRLVRCLLAMLGDRKARWRLLYRFLRWRARGGRP